MHTHEAPASTAGNEYCAQFVSESQWSQDLSVALASLKFTLGCLRQAHSHRVASHHPYALVHIVLEEFILAVLGRGTLRDLVNHPPVRSSVAGSMVLKKERSMGMTVRSRFMSSMRSVRESSPV